MTGKGIEEVKYVCAKLHSNVGEKTTAISGGGVVK